MDRFEREERELEAKIEPAIFSPCPHCGVVNYLAEVTFPSGTAMATSCGNCLKAYPIYMENVRPKHFIRFHDSARSLRSEEETVAHHINEGRIRLDEC